MGDGAGGVVQDERLSLNATIRVAFRPEAQQELLEAQAWYEARAEGLGLEFGRAFEVALLSALRRPMGFPALEGELRRVLVRRFPYAVFYWPQGDELLVVAVFHHRRDPGVLARRHKAKPEP